MLIDMHVKLFVFTEEQLNFFKQTMYMLLISNTLNVIFSINTKPT